MSNHSPEITPPAHAPAGPDDAGYYRAWRVLERMESAVGLGGWVCHLTIRATDKPAVWLHTTTMSQAEHLAEVLEMDPEDGSHGPYWSTWREGVYVCVRLRQETHHY